MKLTPGIFITLFFYQLRSFNPSHYRTSDAQETETEMELATPRKKLYQNVWSKKGV